MSSETKMSKQDRINYFEKLKQKWKELSIEDIIIDGLYSNSIRFVKEYAEKVLKLDLKQDRIHEVGLKSVLQLLADKDLRGAEILLKNMNFDANQKIYQICFFTLYKQLRDYLISVLIDRKKLNENELEMIEYMKKLEMVYSSRSFQNSRIAIQDFRWKMESENCNKNFRTGDLITFVEDKTKSDKEYTLYSHVVIEWIRGWTNEVKHEILTDGIILYKTNLREEIQRLNPHTLLSVLIDQNNIRLLMEWIDFSYKFNNTMDESIFKTKITQNMLDMLDENKRLLPESKEILLNYLAKYNVISEKEKKSSELYMARLSSSSTLFNEDFFKLRDNDFHSQFILSFKKFLPGNFIWLYFDFHANLFDSKVLEKSMTYERGSSLSLLKAFRQYKSNDFIPALISENFAHVNRSNINNLEQSQFKLSDLVDSNHQENRLLAIASTLYSGTSISASDWKKLDKLMEDYPALHLITESKRLREPVSLYHLFEEHTKLDMTKCFTWQKANSIDLFKNNEDTVETSSNSHSLISFENEDFVMRYGLKEHFDYAYFLKQCRPFFAYDFFIRNQLEHYGKINKTIIEEAKLRTNLILIENYDTLRIVSSCLTFSELLNADTFKLKLNVYLMNMLKDYYMRRGMDEEISSEKCKHLFKEFFKSEHDAKRLISIFEQVLVDITIEKFDLKNMFTMSACSVWLPLMCFCKINNLPYTCKYLQLCAESNEWLMFLIFAQIYQIPRYQVISSLEFFNDIGLKQHLEYALHNVINSAAPVGEEKSSAKKANNNGKDRLKKPKKVFKTINKKINSIDSSDEEDTKNENESDLVSNDKYQICLDSIDFYELLINCQNVTDPVLQLQMESLRWFTPVLSVFATFYQQHDKISCLCTFLYSSMKLTNTQSMLVKHKDYSALNQSVLFDLDDLKEAIQIAASKSYLRTLLNALRIFIPNTILDIYVEFIYNVFVVKDAIKAENLYQVYRTEFTKVTLNKHQSYIPLEWYEEVINKLTRITLLKCPTIDDLQILNRIFPKGNDYCRLIKLVHILKGNKINVYSEDWFDVDDKSEQFNDICLKVIEELLKKQKFNEAEELAEYCELSKSTFHRIHLARIGRQIEMLRLNNDFEEILMFWKSSHIQLMKIGIKDSDFIDFLKFQNRRSNLVIERIVLLNLISQLCPNDQETSKSLWQLLLHFVNDHKKKNELNYLKEIFKKMLLFEGLKTNAIKELLEYVIEEGVANDFSDHNKNINEQDKDALNILLLNLVDIGKLKQAYVIAKYFKYYNQDLRILLNMLYICYDMIKPKELDFNMHTLETGYKGIKLTNVLRSLSRSSDNPDEIVKDRIESLEKLAGLCQYGDKFCNRIKMYYRLANEFLNMTYSKILNENEWNLLKAVLYSDVSNKFELSRKFVRIYDLNQDQLCDFMLDEILVTLKLHVRLSSNMSLDGKKLMFDPNNNDEFSKLIKIFKKNSNQFGLKLYEKSRKLLVEAKDTDDYVIVTELLIRSHSFFSQTCFMEGISNVLRTSKMLANQLEKAGKFNIMIRLLTGIEHFSEMTYIMDYLWNNQQFEMLFGKGIGKNDKLRLALLDYLKRYHPNDHETYTMVTLNFTMHREIAIMLEEAAYQQLKLLESKTIESTPEILTDLQSILQYFSDAAQSFMKEDCVKQAESCIKKARLIALQIHFLSMNHIVINLTNSAASKFIINHTNFWESYIVSEAYEKKSEWPLVLFTQFILNNNQKYLNDFCKHIQLTSNMIEDISNRFKLSNESNALKPQAIANMKHLLKYTKDIGQYYRIISVLEFHDCISDIKKEKNFSIINDLILNKKI